MGATASASATKDRRSTYRRSLMEGRLVFLQHDFSGLDDDFDGIALLEPHGFSTASCDHTFDEVVAHFYDNVGHYSTELKLLDDTGQLIASRKRHGKRLAEIREASSKRRCRLGTTDEAAVRARRADSSATCAAWWHS